MFYLNLDWAHLKWSTFWFLLEGPWTTLLDKTKRWGSVIYWVHLRPTGSQSPDTYHSCQIKSLQHSNVNCFYQDEREKQVFFLTDWTLFQQVVHMLCHSRSEILSWFIYVFIYLFYLPKHHRDYYYMDYFSPWLWLSCSKCTHKDMKNVQGSTLTWHVADGAPLSLRWY